MAEWQLSWRDHVWTAADLTISDLIVVGELLQVDSWAALEPTASPRACVGVLAVLIAKATGVPIEEAQAAVLGMSLPEFVGCLDIV